MIEIYTDGACNQTTKLGGWAFAIYDDDKVVRENSGKVENTTNNQMEMTAAIRALEEISTMNIGHFTLFTDSSYMANGVNDGWVWTWKENGWLNYDKKPVANKKLWTQLHNFVIDIGVKMERVSRRHPQIKYVDRKARAQTKV